jgi:hypothetical protein
VLSCLDVDAQATKTAIIIKRTKKPETLLRFFIAAHPF